MFVGRFPSTAGAILTPSHALDARAELRELLLDALVAAVEMIDPVDPSLALGDQTGDHEARLSAQVRRHHVRPLEPGDAVYDRGIARDLDFGAEAPHFQGVHQAVLENGFSDHARGLPDPVLR